MCQCQASQLLGEMCQHVIEIYDCFKNCANNTNQILQNADDLQVTTMSMHECEK